RRRRPWPVARHVLGGDAVARSRRAEHRSFALLFALSIGTAGRRRARADRPRCDELRVRRRDRARRARAPGRDLGHGTQPRSPGGARHARPADHARRAGLLSEARLHDASVRMHDQGGADVMATADDLAGWTAVDRYFTDALIGADPVLDAIIA